MYIFTSPPRLIITGIRSIGICIPTTTFVSRIERTTVTDMDTMKSASVPILTTLGIGRIIPIGASSVRPRRRHAGVGLEITLSRNRMGVWLELALHRRHAGVGLEITLPPNRTGVWLELPLHRRHGATPVAGTAHGGGEAFKHFNPSGSYVPDWFF